METLPRRSQTTRIISKFTQSSRSSGYRTQFYPSDRGLLSRPGRLGNFPYDRSDRLNIFLRRLGRSGHIIWKPGIPENETMENFAASLVQVEIDQGFLKPNYDHKVRTRMKRSRRRKFFSPKLRTWIGQRSVRTLYDSRKLAQLAAEMRRYRLKILGVSKARWNQFGKANWQRESFSYTRGKSTKMISMRVGLVSCYQAGHVQKCVMEWEPIDHRIITARIKAIFQMITIIHSYAPMNSTEPYEKEEF